MKDVINWARSNLLIVLSVLVALVAVGGLFLAHAQGKQVARRAEGRRAQIQEIRGLMRTPVTLPPVRPGGDPQKIELILNLETIDKLRDLYGRMGNEYSAIFDHARVKNQFGVTRHERYANPDTGHGQMMAGLFPESGDLDAPFKAMSAYRQAFARMVGPYDPESPYPALNAGMPPFPEDIQVELDGLMEGFARDNTGGTTDRLDPQLTERLQKMLKTRAMEMLARQAQSIHLYSPLPLETDDRRGVIEFPADFAFDVGAWSDFAAAGAPGIGGAAGNAGPPTIKQMWEGQMGLWFQQDIAEVIARVNRVEDEASNVLNAVVKRLIRIRLLPGYVGIDNQGAVHEAPAMSSATAMGPAARRAMPGGGAMMGPGAQPMAPGGRHVMPSRPGMGPGAGMFPGPGMGGMPGMMGDRRRRDDTGSDEEYEPVTGDSEDAPLDEDFEISHTGRRSNAIYDVCHATVLLVIDAQRMPEFFHALGEVNFMTVLRATIRDVDEYEALLEGFVYGSGDAIEVELVIESIWLRSMTSAWMPDIVKSRVGILSPDDDAYVDPYDQTAVMGRTGVPRR